ncbi:unnamed protein product [Paramecium sonneborni]|uniref:Uncharacterized protein n=1 Tax=Paramecium sonneborni TaxID=65129 RepID=A0A8S1RNK9_9CILI|nr:unnamed protein product [Paramecium sonneborni]
MRKFKNISMIYPNQKINLNDSPKISIGNWVYIMLLQYQTSQKQPLKKYQMRPLP